MRKSTLSGITGLLLAGVLAAGVCCAGYASRNADGKWFKNSDLSTWHWSDNSTADKDGDNISGVPVDGMTVKTESSNLVKLRSTPMTASNGQTDSTYYLTATVEPADADEQELVWSVEFKDSNSWTNGKTASSYVSVTPTSDTHNATVTCLSDFGAPIIVKVASKENPDIWAYCTCDYVKRVKSINFTVADPSFTTSFKYTYEIEPTAYTIDSEFKLGEAKLELRYNFLMAIKNRINDSIFNEICYVNTDYNYLPQLVLDNQNQTLTIPGGKPSSLVVFSDSWSEDEDYYDVSAEEIARYKALFDSEFRKTVKGYTDNHARLYFNYSIEYDRTIYSTDKVVCDLNFNYNTIKVPVSSVKLNNDNVIF